MGGNYIIPSDIIWEQKMNDLIKNMLTPDPKYRPSAVELLDLINNYFNIKTIPLNAWAKQDNTNKLL